MNKNRIKDVFWRIAEEEQDILRIKIRVLAQICEEVLLAITRRIKLDNRQLRMLKRLIQANHKILIVFGRIDDKNNLHMTEKVISDFKFIYEVWEELFRYLHDYFDSVSKRLDDSQNKEDFLRNADETSYKYTTYMAQIKIGQGFQYPISEPELIRSHCEKTLNLILGNDLFEKFRLESNIAIDEINILLQQLTLMCPDNGQIH